MTQAGVDALEQDLIQHARFGDKVSGGPGDLATAQWIGERLADLGYEVERENIAVPHFEPRDCSLSVPGHCAPVYWQSPTVPTSPDGIAAPLAVLRDPLDAAGAAGCIALLVLAHARHASLTSPLIAPLVDAAVAAGAAALVVVPTGPTGEVVALNAPLASPPSALPMAVLAPRDAAPFLQAARSAAEATLRLHGIASVRETPNLYATRRRGSGWICLSTPRTGWFHCTAERGTGTAAFLHMAAWLPAAFPDHSLLLVNTGAHEYQFAGAHRALERSPEPAHTAVWVHLGAGLAARARLELRGVCVFLPSPDPNRATMATDALRSIATAAFAGQAGLEHVIPPVAGTSELGAIVAHGHTRALAVIGVPTMFHTRSDDLSAVDAGLLRPVVEAHKRVIAQAIALDPTPAAGCVA